MSRRSSESDRRERPAIRGTDDSWGTLYAGGSPKADGSIGKAQIAARRRFRRNAWLSVVAVLVVLGIVGYFTVPRWIYNSNAYTRHVLGPYADQLPTGVRDDLDRALPQLQTFVEQHRGQRFAAAPEFVYLPPKNFHTEVDREIAFDQYDVVAGSTLRALGWLGDPQQFGLLRENLQASGVVAFYGRFDGSIYLGGKRIDDVAKAQIVRALTAALDDSAFNASYALHGTDHDRRLAAQALVDGDAVETEQAWVATLPADHRCAVAEGAALSGVPGCGPVVPSVATTAAVRSLVLFPSEVGPQFIRALRDHGGAHAVDKAFGAPPQSTYAVLEPAEYLAGASPAVLDYPPHQGQLVDFGVLGDYAISLFLAGGQPAAVRAHDVSGWRGDAYSTYVTSGRTCVRDRVLLASESDVAALKARVVSAGGKVVASGATTLDWTNCSG